MAAGPHDQSLKSRAKERQSAGRVGVADQALIFAPASVPLPVPAFATPMRLDHLGHVLVAFGFKAPTGHEMPIEFFVVRGLDFGRRLLGGGAVARFEKLFGFGKVRALRIGLQAAEFTLDGASVSALG
jgi:hypothetical protein